jgi:DNA-binding phage protein
MKKPSAKLTVERQTAPRKERTAEELAELRAVRERFQRDKPTLEQVLAETSQAEAVPLGQYLQTQELLHALRQERERQRLTLAELAARTGYDPAVLSRLLSGRQANPTLATVGRLANALGKELIHSLRDVPNGAQGDRPPPDAGKRSRPRRAR